MYIQFLVNAQFCKSRVVKMGVFTGLLDWNTGQDYWTDIL